MSDPVHDQKLKNRPLFTLHAANAALDDVTPTCYPARLNQREDPHMLLKPRPTPEPSTESPALQPPQSKLRQHLDEVFAERRRLESLVKLDEDTLLCPLCGSNNMHHAGVRVQHRLREDEHGLEVTVGDVITTKRLSAEQLNGRRNSLEIDFWCEGCGMDRGAVARLCLQQHKGLTLVTWERVTIPSDQQPL